jgi:hypothetical protein
MTISEPKSSLAIEQTCYSTPGELGLNVPGLAHLFHVNLG